MNENLTNHSTTNEIPPVLPSDYIQIVFLVIVIIIGLPSNALVLNRIITLYKGSHKDSVKAGYLLLKLNLTVSDLMLLLFFATPKVIWMITYEWLGSDILCKLHNYLSMASFYLSSNIIVCIALDRLRTVLGASKIRRGRKTVRSIRILTIFAWTFALTWASPQLIVHQTVDILSSPNESWIQCTDVWSIDQALQQKTGLPDSLQWILNGSVKVFYEITHLILVFWGPLIVLLISYAIIAMRLARVSLQGPQGAIRMQTLAEPNSNSTKYIIDSDEPSSVMVLDQKNQKRFSLSPPKIFTARSRNGSTKLVNDTTLSRGAMQPMWRRRLRGKLFRSTLLIVAFHFLFWFPYNFSALVGYIDEDANEILSNHVNVFNDLQLMITLVNPSLYAFTQ